MHDFSLRHAEGTGGCTPCARRPAPLPDDAVQAAPNVPGINCAKCEAAKDPYPLTKVQVTVK